ncbi:type II secretion system minor pseudopilin GspJ [Vibrio sp. Isolate23]|uniref:type II secretion system minor pseudopilin GspJ n=1 Tax=Vibrio TaxID=662 RepID=UPI001EFDBA53|nr:MULTISPECIES: type II secretion system minor pseudopilin GspJ [Vibrio]MCG9680905.1 type II secretion system minor pseudopilin GspJ [Vibrio sp. Isolate24]MCG9683864.1 type II secretion system minor pseudopilin GspJ [Vibrio sp. Isolate23]USD32643.1 type II secretion system minor pseudopilin GspJ [Vibrio sp. SCSIO 43186]USD45684.1 type II secretion system minor pseudopilin GspJ [Vibrio sp. SCSIO 43145]USD69768.1 type II secretion system minor pseudopilin GspJ [Vibrio sp. SCSIO 43139]
MCRNKQSAFQSGFTLIEVLVAIAIFASLSVGAYQVLNQVQRSNALSLERSERLKTLQRALVFMDGDFRQMALRQTRTNGEESNGLLLHWKEYLLDSDAKGIMFTRLGWHNPQQQFPRGEISKVGYRIKDDVLERVWWRYADTPAGQAGITMPLIDKVEKFNVKFFDGSDWKKEWDQKAMLPQAVAVELELEDYGKIERIYMTAGGGIGGAEEKSDDS